MKWFDRLKQAGKHKVRAETVSPNNDVQVLSEPAAEPAPEISPSVPVEIAEANASNDGQAVSKLSPRETEVFLRLLEGAKMREIADELGVKTSTVNGYCSHIYKSLGVNSKAQLILRYSSCRVNKGREGDG